MRDKERIRKFCDEFAALWEQQPDLRFGQIISTISRFDDPFYLEEDKMMEALKQYFTRKNRAPKNSERELERSQLENGWTVLLDALQDELVFDLEEFKILFIKTWQYFMTYGKETTIDIADISIVNSLACFAFFNNYPEETSCWEFDVCLKLAKGLASSIKEPKGRYCGNLFDGFITVEVYHNDYSEVKIDEFESFFEELSETYHEQNYPDD